MLTQFISTFPFSTKKSVSVLLMQTPSQGGHSGAQTQSYRGTGPCWPPYRTTIAC